jgi:glycosyltransferase involved in cell wall biosynthesis
MRKTLSIIIIAGNFQNIISRCLDSVNFADEIIVVLANSTDNTSSIIKKNYPQVITTIVNDEYNKNFSIWRNIGFKLAKSNWILYVDTDEVVTPSLQLEINKVIQQEHLCDYYVIPRANYYLGQRVKFGGSYPDYVKRLFLKDKFHGFTGNVHEEPVITGTLGYLKSDLLHFTHTDLTSMLQKSIVWTDTEAKLLFSTHHPPIVWWRIIRMMFTKFFQRLFLQRMWRDGVVGFISVIFETFNTFIIYSRLWEMQNTPQTK